MFLLCKNRDIQNFKGREIIMKLPIGEKLQELTTMNWLFSSFFPGTQYGVFQCCFSIFLHTTYITWFPWNFFSFCSNFSVLSTSFMPWPLVPISLSCKLISNSWRRSDQLTMSFRCQPLYRELIFCWLLTSAVWPRPRSRLNHKVYNVAVKCEADGQSSFQKICVARASMLTSEGHDSTCGCHDFCLSGIFLVFYLW